jgi:hypothetical protein
MTPPDAGASPSKPKRPRVEAEFDTSACQNFKSALNRSRAVVEIFWKYHF